MFNETDWIYEEVELQDVPEALRNEIEAKLASNVYESVVVKRIEKATLVADGERWWNVYLEMHTARDNWFYDYYSYCEDTEELFSERIPMRALKFSSLYQNK